MEILSRARSEWELLSSDPSVGEDRKLNDESRTWLFLVEGDFEYSAGHMPAAASKFMVRAFLVLPFGV